MRTPTMIGSVLTAAFAIATLSTGAGAASAVQKECAAKYQTAKAANQLNGQTYNQYYKACAAEVKAGASAPEPAATTTAAPAPAKTAPARVSPTEAAAPAAPGSAVFPVAVSPEFSKMTAGKARMQTCLAQYKKNKDDNGNGGLRWIQKGGGYYSECNKRLKG